MYTDLPHVIAGYASHVVVHRREDGNGIARDVDPSEHLRRLRDSRQLGEELVRREMGKLQEEVILQLPDTPVWEDGKIEGSSQSL